MVVDLQFRLHLSYPFHRSFNWRKMLFLDVDGSSFAIAEFSPLLAIPHSKCGIVRSGENGGTITDGRLF